MTPDPAVTGLEVAAYRVPTEGPEADGTLAWEATTMVVVHARAGETVGTGWTFAPRAAVQVVTDLLADVAVGTDALAPAATEEAMTRAVRNVGRSGVAGCAISAVDTALWDLAARLLGLPLHRLLGGGTDRVPIYGSGGFTTYDDDRLCHQLEGWVGVGAEAVKIKIGESWGRREDRDLHRVALTRRCVGEDIAVFVDANGGYTAQQAVRVGRALEEVGVTWFEEPVSSEDLAGLRHVRAHMAADVTAGEYGFVLDDFARLAAAEAIDCLQIDATRCGGFSGWRRAAAVAAAHQLDVSAHCAPYLHAAPAAATPRARHVEYFHDHARIARLLLDGAEEPVAGQLRCSDDPGHGLALRTSDAESYRVA